MNENHYLASQSATRRGHLTLHCITVTSTAAARKINFQRQKGGKRRLRVFSHKTQTEQCKMSRVAPANANPPLMLWILLKSGAKTSQPFYLMYIGPGWNALAPSASVKVTARLDEYPVLWHTDLLQCKRVCVDVFVRQCLCVRKINLGRSLKWVAQKNQ